MNIGSTLFGCVGLLGLAYLLRAIPIWLSPHGLGIDHWYWKCYVEEYKRNGRFPPELPQYVLEKAQWYPPLFPLLIARLPGAVFDRFSSQIAILVDLARMLLLIGVAAWQTGGQGTIMLMAALVYATTPIQVSYNVQLNPRGLAAIMLDILLVALLWIYQGGPWWAWGVATVLGGLILLTHKMTTQLLWFLVLATAAVYRWWELLLLIPGTIGAALVMSRGFYANVLRAHWDIVAFWMRNWQWVGADPIRESPVYGDRSYERPRKLHQAGIRGFLWSCFILIGFNPAAWISCLLVYERVFVDSALLIYPTPFLVWLLLICAFAWLTTFVPHMKCLGAGYLYVYNTSLLASLIVALTFEFTRVPRVSTPFVVVAIVLNVCGLLVYYRQSLQDTRTRVDDGLMRMIEELRGRPPGVVMCIPSQWSEVVAYRTGNPVLWGGHGYGFKLLQPTWPRLLLPMAEVIRRYHVRYLLTMDEMLPPNFESDLPAVDTRHGKYRLYAFAEVVTAASVTRPDAEGAAATTA